MNFKRKSPKIRHRLVKGCFCCAKTSANPPNLLKMTRGNARRAESAISQLRCDSIGVRTNSRFASKSLAGFVVDA